jgi:hypothetical protein
MGVTLRRTKGRTDDWAKEMPAEEWRVYRPVLDSLRERGVRFSVGGGLAFSYYSTLWRNTKDLDIYIEGKDLDAVVGILTTHGFEDYFPQQEYDRAWIYRGFKDGLIFDVIWSTPNKRGDVDEAWVTAGPETTVGGVPLRVLPAEELIFAKLWVFQRHRCDWPDLLNVLWGVADWELDWDRLLGRVGEDRPLLAGLMSVFAWLCPDRAALLPGELWSALSLPAPTVNGAACGEGRRADLLESRPWFAPVEKRRQRGEVM